MALHQLHPHHQHLVKAGDLPKLALVEENLMLMLGLVLVLVVQIIVKQRMVINQLVQVNQVLIMIMMVKFNRFSNWGVRKWLLQLVV
jgi:hypothetical protein